jgi:hypothetical protein
MIQVADDFLPPAVAEGLRKEALSREFRSFHFEHCSFHGISIMSLDSAIPFVLRTLFDRVEPTLSFLRKSPAGQQEPHFIHTDIDMGEWSAIYYLNPDPPAGDGTAFWTHRATGAIESSIPHERSEEGQSPDAWERRQLVEARFNRLLLFPSSYFHSRAIFENWSQSDDARLMQVTFGRGSIL